MTLVAEFHEAFGTTDPRVPTPPDRAKAALRLRLIEEEFKEVRFELRALMLSDEVNTPISDRLTIMARLLKELCDLQYVVQGTADSLGFGESFEHAYHEVHRANMSKTGGGTRSDGKVLKGPNYKPADMEQFVHVLDPDVTYELVFDDEPADMDSFVHVAESDPPCNDGECMHGCIDTCYYNDGRN